MYDRLTMAVEGRYSNYTVTPLILLPLIEGVLGYKSVLVDGHSWRYRRDVEFRKYGY
jgi:hypothetical protein